MTKLKSKKLSKSTIAIILMAIAMVAILSFGATFALFTASTTQITNGNTAITTGKVSLTTSGSLSFVTSSKVFPGDDITTGSLIVTPETGTYADTAEYVAVKITLTIQNGSGQPLTPATYPLTINWARAAAVGDNGDTFLDATGHWVQSSEAGVYVYMARANDTPASQAALGISAATNVLDGITFDAFDHFAEGGSASDASLMGATINVTIDFRAVQAKNTNFANANAVATYLFGASGGYETGIASLS